MNGGIVKAMLKVLGGVMLALVFLLGSLLAGGRYEIQSAGMTDGGGVMRLDKWTGETMLCVPRRCLLYPTTHPDPLPPPEIKIN